MELKKKTMQIAMIGLGKMGANMTVRLLNDGHRVVAYDLNEETIAIFNCLVFYLFQPFFSGPTTYVAGRN